MELIHSPVRHELIKFILVFTPLTRFETTVWIHFECMQVCSCLLFQLQNPDVLKSSLWFSVTDGCAGCDHEIWASAERAALSAHLSGGSFTVRCHDDRHALAYFLFSFTVSSTFCHLLFVSASPVRSSRREPRHVWDSAVSSAVSSAVTDTLGVLSDHRVKIAV